MSFRCGCQVAPSFNLIFCTVEAFYAYWNWNSSMHKHGDYLGHGCTDWPLSYKNNERVIHEMHARSVSGHFFRRYKFDSDINQEDLYMRNQYLLAGLSLRDALLSVSLLRRLILLLSLFWASIIVRVLFQFPGLFWTNIPSFFFATVFFSWDACDKS